jgi:hypothetical protein
VKNFEGLLHLLLVPHPQEIGVKEQTPKGFPGRLHLIPKQHCVLTQLPLFDGEQQRHPLHVRNGSPVGIIAFGANDDRYVVLCTGTNSSSSHMDGVGDGDISLIS